MDLGGRPPGLGRLLALVTLLLAVAAGARLLPLGDLLSAPGVLSIVGSARDSWWGPSAFVAAYALSTAVALPATAFTLAGGALYGFGWGLLWNSLGANLGATLAFYLARGLGRDGLLRLVGDRREALDRATEAHGFVAVLTMRLVPLFPFAVVNYAGGLAGMPWSRYGLATLVGGLPATAIYTFFADALLQGSREASREAWIRALLAGVLLVALGALPPLARRLRGARPAGARRP
ncbi:MAG: TVP38/TMEM64 family protein [Gemmatimonadota bacterium]